MHAKHALYASQAHPFVHCIQNLFSGRFTVRYRVRLRMEATTAELTQLRLGSVFCFSIFDRPVAMTGSALGHPTMTSRRCSHYQIFQLMVAVCLTLTPISKGGIISD